MTNAMSKPSMPIDDIENRISKYKKGELAIKSCKLPDLKAFAKYYKLRITGTKPELVERIETYFKKNKNATIIQALFRGHLVRFSIRLRGCALKERTKCVNDSDAFRKKPFSLHITCFIIIVVNGFKFIILLQRTVSVRFDK